MNRRANSNPNRHATLRGKAAEDRAESYLHRQGLVTVERNYRCRFGELDIIMRDNALLVFIEVRQRSDTSFMHPVQTLTKAKQKRLLLAANRYLLRFKVPPACRFDFVTIAGPNHQIEWRKNVLESQ